MIPQLDWISHQLRLAVESWQNTNPLNKGTRKNLTPLLSDSSWITQEGSYILSHSLVGPFVFQLMSPIQQELLNKGVRFFLTPLLTRSTRITQQWGSGQSPFKKNHSTVGFGPIPVQEESLNSGVRANPRSRRITQQWGSGQSPFKKNHSTVGFGPIPV